MDDGVGRWCTRSATKKRIEGDVFACVCALIDQSTRNGPKLELGGKEWNGRFRVMNERFRSIA
jgi:hypothetical protein